MDLKSGLSSLSFSSWIQILEDVNFTFNGLDSESSLLSTKEWVGTDEQGQVVKGALLINLIEPIIDN